MRVGGLCQIRGLNRFQEPLNTEGIRLLREGYISREGQRKTPPKRGLDRPVKKGQAASQFSSTLAAGAIDIRSPIAFITFMMVANSGFPPVLRAL